MIEHALAFQQLVQDRFGTVGAILPVSAKGLCDLLGEAIAKGIHMDFEVAGITAAFLDGIKYENRGVMLYDGTSDIDVTIARMSPGIAQLVVAADPSDTFAVFSNSSPSNQIELSDYKGTRQVDGRPGVLIYPIGSSLKDMETRMAKREYLGLAIPALEQIAPADFS